MKVIDGVKRFAGSLASRVNIIKSMRLRAKLFLLVGVAFAGLVLALGAALYVLTEIKIGSAKYKEISANRSILEKVALVGSDLNSFRSETAHFIIETDPDKMKQIDGRLREIEEQVKTKFEAIMAEVKHNEDKKLVVEDARSTWQEFLETTKSEVIPAVLRGDRGKAKNLEDGIQGQRYNRYSEQIDSMVNLLRLEIDEMETLAVAKATKTTALLALFSAILFVVVAVLTILIGNAIIRPVLEAAGFVGAVALGDLTRTLENTSTDETGRLGQALNSMVSGVKVMISGIRKSSVNLEAMSDSVGGASNKIADGSQAQHAAIEEAASSMNEMHFSLKEIGGSVEDLNTTVEQTSSAVIETSASSDEVARTMQDLSAMVEETSTAISQMSAAIREIAGSVESLSSIAEGTASSVGEISASVKEVESSALQSAKLAEAVTADASELGMRSIEKAIDGMRLIDEETRRTAEVINRLGGRAENIGSILTVIEDITDKTALLALNAAILAAQAGEHGKGFSVVAVEIRELANRTAASTQEISNLIKSVQEESREAVAVMQKGVALVEDGTRLTNDAGAALKKILERAGQSRDMSGIISRATVEQTVGMKQVSDAVEKVSAMTRQIARATSEQRTGSDQIIRASERMREIARFVTGATTEQVKAGKEIVAAVETISIKIGQVHRASTEVRSGSDLIVKAIERIKTIAKENALQADQLKDSVQVMTAQAVSLKSDVERFRV